jgi:Reverse transcriptase (RNA-dependent DNA polymerase)
VFSNISNCKAEVKHLKISDHSAIFVDVNINIPKPQSYSKKRNFSDIEKIKLAKIKLKNVNWSAELVNNEPNMSYEKFESIFLNIIDEYFPINEKTKNLNNISLPWYNEECEKQKNYTKLLLDMLKDNHNDDFIKECYLKQKLHYLETLKNCQISFNSQKIIDSKNPIKEIWNVVKENSNHKAKNNSNITKLYSDSTKTSITTNPKEISNILNTHYINAPKIIHEKTRVTNPSFVPKFIEKSLKNEKTFYLYPVNEAEINKYINNLSESSACDVDFMSSKDLKLFGEEIAEPISNIINQCFETGIFPDNLKISKIVPLLKPGDELDPNNHRPVAILKIISKIFEKAIYVRMVDFLKNNDLFNKSQHGFLRNKSTTTALFEYMENVIKSLDEKELVFGLFIDLSKAFDCVDPNILMEKLDLYGVRGIPQKLLKSYMSNRRQCVQVRSEKNLTFSDVLKNEIGLPQGSILGPLLFIIYVNDLIIKNQSISCTLFADDTSFRVKHRNFENLVKITNELIEDINFYFSSNKLKLNASKTHLVHFQLSNQNIDNNYVIKCEDEEIMFTDHTKLLGLQIDKNVKWDHQIIELCKKLNKAIYTLRCLKNRVEPYILKYVYFAYFHSVLTYGLEIWGGAAAYLINRVFKLQKRAIRLLSGVAPRDSCQPLFITLNILPLPALYIFQVLVFSKKYTQYFQNSKFQHSYNTRNKDLFMLEKHRTAKYESGLLYCAELFYNKLPQNIRTINEIHIFKLKLKEYLLNRNIYNISDF